MRVWEVPCANDCNEQWIDRSLDGSWVVNYPEPVEGVYGEMVWAVSGSVVQAHYLSGLLPGQDATVFTGVVAKVSSSFNTYTVRGRLGRARARGEMEGALSFPSRSPVRHLMRVCGERR